MDSKQHHREQRLSFANCPAHVDVYEVGARDGLQNEKSIVSTQDKARLVEAMIAAGERRIEISSFVGPKWVPQLADAEELIRSVAKTQPDVRFSALVPNHQGFERALASGITEIALLLSASESHSQKNLNKSIEVALKTASQLASEALAQKIRVRCYLSTVWGCPYEGTVAISKVVQLAQEALNFGIYQLSLGDTIGVGNPKQTAEILDAVLEFAPKEKIALHFHDTRGTALSNALVGLSYGISTFDTSIGGLGGCPYAPGAAGNLSTEDFVYMLRGLGIESGVDFEKLVDAGALAQQLMGRPLPSKALTATLASRTTAKK